MLFCFHSRWGFKGFGNETKKLSAKKRPNVLVRVPETVSVLLKFLISKTFERRAPKPHHKGAISSNVSI